VASPLSEAIAAGSLRPGLLLPLIEAREAEAYGDFETQDDWHVWLLAGAGGLAVAAAAALGASEPGLFRPFGAAYGVAGLCGRAARWRRKAAACCRAICWHDMAWCLKRSFRIRVAAARAVLTDIAAVGRGLAG